MAQISTVFLFGLRFNPDTNRIELSCTSSFFRMVTTQMTEPNTCRDCIGSFHFVSMSDGQYEGVTLVGESAYAEARTLCYRILAIYRCAITFELVFERPGSYASWLTFNHRPPSSKQLEAISKQLGIHVPFLGFPYTSPLMEDERLDRKLSASLNKCAGSQVYHSKHETPYMPRLVKSVNSINPLLAAFKPSASATSFQGTSK